MTHKAFDALRLLATPPVWGRFDDQRPGDETSQLLIIAGVAALLAVAMLIWHLVADRSQRRFTSNSPAHLFRELSNAHGLSNSSRRLLKRVAAAHQIASPALLFVQPGYFDTSNLPASLAPNAKELQTLHDQLFS
jgi:hypothetical protein